MRPTRFERVLLALLTCSLTLAGTLMGAPSRPNVVLILADDLGYETLGVNGGTSYQTPVLDKLAAQSIRFDHCFVQPLCTPTRVQLMTGIYNVRNYFRFGNMDTNATTFGNLFQNAGYATCMAGKWQLGHNLELPQKFGFDEYCLWQHTRRPERYKNPGLEINGVEKNWTNNEYGPDIVSDYALDFIQRKKDVPFFLYYPMILTHEPFTPTPDSLDYINGGKIPRSKSQHFADMVAYTDKLVGKLLARLEQLGLRENTLVIFLGDNGTENGFASQMGNRTVIGGKGRTTETGMHVPLIVNWPGKIKPAKVSSDLVDSTDFLPTICEAANVTVPKNLKLDGRSFYPQLLGEKGHPREWVYCWYSREGVLAQAKECAFNQRFKLYRSGEFYDLTQDITEQHPMKVATLTGEPATAAKSLQSALDRYQNARPIALRNLKGPKGKKAAE